MNQPACVDIIPTMLACQVWGQYHLSLHNLHRGNLVKNEGRIASGRPFFQLHIYYYYYPLQSYLQVRMVLTFQRYTYVF